MIRKLKAFGLALGAIFVTGALMVSAAQAQGKFTWASGTQELTAEQDGTPGQVTALQKLHTTFGDVTCEEIRGEATVSGTEGTEITLKTLKAQNFGKVEQCTGPVGTQPKVEFNGCDFLFTVGQTMGQTGMETTGQLHIKCPMGKQITISAPLLQIHIPEQSPAGGFVAYHAITGSPNHVTIEAAVKGIKYQGTELGSSGTDGEYSGNLTVKAYNGLTHNSSQQTNLEVH